MVDLLLPVESDGYFVLLGTPLRSTSLARKAFFFPLVDRGSMGYSTEAIHSAKVLSRHSSAGACRGGAPQLLTASLTFHDSLWMSFPKWKSWCLGMRPTLRSRCLRRVSLDAHLWHDPMCRELYKMVSFLAKRRFTEAEIWHNCLQTIILNYNSSILVLNI